MKLLQLLADNLIWLAIFIALFSLLIGSFLNVVILRFPVMMFRSWKQDCLEMDSNLPKHPAIDDLSKPFNLLKPDSHCPKCQAPVRAWQNIPVLSWVLLRGKCAGCGTPIGLRYPAVEIATAILSTALLLVYPWGWQLAAMLVFTWLLISMSVIDIDHQILPDTMTLSLLWLGLMVNSQGLFTDLESAVYGAAAGYLALWSVFWIFKLVTGKEGMGYGDFKLLAALGAWLGVQSLPLIILLSSVVGAVAGIAGIIILGRDKNVPIPFGPYLAAAGWIAALWGNDISQWYLSRF
ncbi:prepilin peptidase [Thalassolituus alkanivorans]|uniref:prepilin peptidase n=1 Tax=Thalassolituus alkanivorans TaxID=2881055 RepID=UPI001E432EC3|nr:A24 family peptidase [Thalassolituus alkanivorans]MCB2388666.1 A24 family peptidase [Thalassolituus alkanivorans]MCB2423615.1 A24 family peptidase [Thalassolituus alkanivorans]